ncbi:MAG TPA: alpha-E domain-containing protein [Acidimicrobiales bacterium]
MSVKEADGSMLLSRIAECVYWSARYMERVEATARLVKVQTELFLDLPRSVRMGWSPLLAITGTKDEYLDRHTADTEEPATEDTVITFLTVDAEHHGSIVASLARARHNLRITRSLFPRSAWEEVNELFLWATDTGAEAVDRRTRVEWMNGVIRRCHLLAGLTASTMLHDDLYSFVEMGRFVERADMTTRVLDVQAHILLRDGQGKLQPYTDVTWIGVLRALDASRALRRVAGLATSGADALRFLLKDPQFPRSVEHCLNQVSRSLLELPRHEEPMAGCAAVQKVLEDVDVAGLSGDGLHQVASDLQDGLADLHDLVTETYFSVTRSDSAILALR